MTGTVSPPLPQPSELTEPFWEAARERRLVRPYCDRCERSFFTPQVICPTCWREDWIWRQSTGLGSVYSWSVVHRAPEPGFEVPYVLATVDLDEGWSMLTNLVGAQHPPQIGQRVRVTWRAIAGDFVLPVFEPDPEQGAVS